MGSKDVNVYDRIELVVVNMDLTARPIEFQFENDVPVAVTKYETVCPACSSMIHFTMDDTVTKDGKIYLGCPHCRKMPAAPVPGQTTKIEPNMIFEKKEKRGIIEKGCPFVDPLELGIFKL